MAVLGYICLSFATIILVLDVIVAIKKKKQKRYENDRFNKRMDNKNSK